MLKFSPNFEKSIIYEYITLRSALEMISKSGLLMVCLVSKETRKFLGIITDSDLRTSLLSGLLLDESIQECINFNPVTASDDMSSEELNDLAHRVGKREIPLLNANGEITDIFVLGLRDVRLSDEVFIQNESNLELQLIDNPMFILAGGLGNRLRSVVNDRPKPLALVGGKPLIETLIDSAISCGFYNFFISINYLAEQIEEYFQANKYPTIRIELIKEKKRLGTAGSLSLIKKNKITIPLVICNADVLTKVQFHKIIRYHIANNSDVTCVVRPYQYVVPYGVAKISGNQIESIEEKPKYDFLVNAGIYVVNPDIINLIHENEFIDMPDLITNCIALGKKISPYLLHEYWIDVGKPEDYKKANEEYHLHFEG
jgi:dTDP-glucose pyrophosphorylase